MTDEAREQVDNNRLQFHDEAASLHDRIHEAAALVSWPDEVEIGWAPEEAIPILAEALQEKFEAGRQSELEAAARERNIDAELLDELVKTLAKELQCGPNAYEIRQAIANLQQKSQTSS